MKTSLKGTHFRSGEYVHVKTLRGNYAFRLLSHDSDRIGAQALLAGLNDQIEKLSRRRDALLAYVQDETISDPNALKV